MAGASVPAAADGFASASGAGAASTSQSPALAAELEALRTELRAGARAAGPPQEEARVMQLLEVSAAWVGAGVAAAWAAAWVGVGVAAGLGGGGWLLGYRNNRITRTAGW